MRKSQLIPKICAAVIFLIIAIIISAPVSSVFLNKVFGGGIIEFGKAGALEYLENRPVEGALNYIIGCAGDDSSGEGFTLKNGTYYYLVSATGSYVKNDKSDNVILLKTLSSSDSYEEFNELYRKIGSAEQAIRISGVVKKSSENEKKIAEQIIKDNNIGEVTYIDYCVDCTKPVSSYTARFLISLIFYAGCVISILLSVQAVKKNRDFDDMEHRRAIMRAARDLKSGEADSNSTDAMFGDADRSYVSSNTQHQGEGQSPVEVARDLEQQSQNQNNQYQSNGQYQTAQQTFGQDDGFFGQQNSSDDKYDGFFGS